MSATAADGTFDARGVISGSYILVSNTREQVSAQLPLNVGDHDVDDVLLTFRPRLEISGTVQVEGADQKHERAIEVGFNPTTIGFPDQAEVGPDGAFALKVMPAVYQVYVTCNSGVYMKSMHFGDQDVTNGRIDLTQQSGGVLKIVCGSDTGKLRGSVQNANGEPAPGALIALSPDGIHQDRPDLFYQVESDQNGKFNFPDLAPGEYKVFAWESMDSNVVLSAEFRKAFEGRAASVTISPGGNSSVDLKLIPAADIEAEKNKLP